jgi:pyruvate dehydrogenase E2 component (dihydrolipoamide acetyltransferase)
MASGEPRMHGEGRPSTRLLLNPAGTAAILAVGGSKPTVVANADGMIGVKKVMNVNLTADHRQVYGAQAAEFLMTLKQVIEDPEKYLLF